MRKHALILALAIVIAALFAVELSGATEQPLTNANVINLVEAGLAEDLIIAKVKQAANVDFQLDADSILALRKHGASDQVVGAMLERTTPPPPAPTLPPGVAAMQARNPWTRSVRLSTKTGDQDLEPHSGTFSTSGFAFIQLKFLNVAGLHSAFRTPDPNATLLVSSEMDPATTNEFSFVRFDVDDDDRVRSVKLGRVMTDEFSSQHAMAPDKDFVVQFSTQSVGPKAFRLVPRAPLSRGEYGLLVRGMVVYDFGVD